MNLKRNMGTADQIFRSIMGTVLIYLGPFSDLLTSDPLSNVLLLILGVLIIGSSLIAWCPLYYMAGISTTKSDKIKD